MERISVIIPVFNDEKRIGKSINSVLNQTYDNLELIVINDGSTDKTLEKIQKYSDKRIRVFTQENQGTGQARNRGLKEATGDFICFVDSDDTIELNFLETMINLIRQKEASIVACSYKNNTGKLYELDKTEAFKYLIALPEKIPMSVAGKIFRKEKLKDLWFDKSNHFEDIKFAVEAFANADKVVYLEKILYNYTQREDSRSKYFKNDDRMKACLGNRELVKQKFPELIDDYITYSLFNSIAIANSMILNDSYNNELLSKVKEQVQNNVESIKKSKYTVWKKWQLYLFISDFTMYKILYKLFKR